MHQDDLVRYDAVRAAMTREIYGLALRRLHTTLAGWPLEALNAALLRRFLLDLSGRGLSPTSQGNSLRAVKTWIRWLSDEGGYGVGDAAWLPKAKVPLRPEDPPRPGGGAEHAPAPIQARLRPGLIQCRG